MAGFLGMRGTGSWATDQRPKNWREMILYLYPNGSAPLTAVLSKISEQSVDDPEFNWWTKSLQKQTGGVTDGKLTAQLTSNMTGSETAGTVVYFKCAEADADNVRIGHVLKVKDTDDAAVYCIGTVTLVNKNGATSVLGTKLLEDNSGLTAALAAAADFQIIGNANPEGGASPDVISYDPVKTSNYTQIFRTPLQISRTAKKTRLRTGDAYKELKREALELHSIEMEKAFIWGVKSENTGATGLPERTTGGIESFLPATNVLDYQNDTDIAAHGGANGNSWMDAGEEFLDSTLELLFRHGSNEKIAFCGSGALLGIQRLAKATGNIQLSPTSTAYGLKVVEWITPFGVVHLKTHPLFSYEAANRNQMLLIEPDKLKYRYIDDTTFIDSTPAGQDGIKEEFLTECGLEIHHPECFMKLKGIGLDNAS